MGGATLILGAQWGDEGKGKLTDILCPKHEVCARAAGGREDNAGHSINVGDKKFAFHLLPSGLINPRALNLIGSGVTFNVPAFFKELKELEEQGIEKPRQRLFVSDRATLCLDLHRAVDGLEEVELGNKKIGTTGRGIGPSYATKAQRSGLRVCDIFNPELFEEKLRILEQGFRKRFGDLLKYNVEEELAYIAEKREELANYVVDAINFMSEVERSDKPLLVEGSQALLLDIDFGTYPYVTSSACGIGGVIQGLALSPFRIKEIIGVVKAYVTRVGSGPFATEDTGEVGTKLQDIGREIGVSTGRRRRCGHQDLVILRYSCAVNHYTGLNLTKLDVLDTFKTIKVAITYKDPATGEEIPSFPADLAVLERAEVVYKELPGWETSTSRVRKYEDLPENARAYVEFIEKDVGVPIKWIGTGPDRDDMIFRHGA